VKCREVSLFKHEGGHPNGPRIQGWENRQGRWNSCRKFISTKSSYWNLKETLIPMSHYGRNNIWLTGIIRSLNLKPWSARFLEYYYVYAHADLAQKYSHCWSFVSSLCSVPGRKLFFPALPPLSRFTEKNTLPNKYGVLQGTKHLYWCSIRDKHLPRIVKSISQESVLCVIDENIASMTCILRIVFLTCILRIVFLRKLPPGNCEIKITRIRTSFTPWESI
jgi:hypothetical protein